MGANGIQERNRKGKKSTNDHEMKIKLEGTDGRIGTVKNTQKRNREDKITKMEPNHKRSKGTEESYRHKIQKAESDNICVVGIPKGQN